MDQGSRAITGNAAAKGLLNSGATLQGLTRFGQGLAAGSFNNYLSQLGGLSGLYGDMAKTGLGAAQLVGAAGTTGGQAAANMIAQAGQSQGTSTANAFNMFGGSIANMNPSNFFAGSGSPALNGSVISSGYPTAVPVDTSVGSLSAPIVF